MSHEEFVNDFLDRYRRFGTTAQQIVYEIWSFLDSPETDCEDAVDDTARQVREDDAFGLVILLRENIKNFLGVLSHAEYLVIDIESNAAEIAEYQLGFFTQEAEPIPLLRDFTPLIISATAHGALASLLFLLYTMLYSLEETTSDDEAVERLLTIRSTPYKQKRPDDRNRLMARFDREKMMLQMRYRFAKFHSDQLEVTTTDIWNKLRAGGRATIKSKTVSTRVSSMPVIGTPGGPAGCLLYDRREILPHLKQAWPWVNWSDWE